MTESIKIGDLIGKNYRVIKIIGGEGVSNRGIIFVCKKNTKIYALKSIQESFLIDEKMIDLFNREAFVHLTLRSHPNIVLSYSYFMENNRPFLILEYIPPDSKGRNTLDHFLQDDITTNNIFKWSIQLCKALEFSKSKGFSPHRDIKPDNIMISPEFNVKLTDFCLIIKNENYIYKKHEFPNNIFKQETLYPEYFEVIGGTPPYMAPEQFEGIYAESSDIYSIGIILFQMVNHGILPFNYNSTQDFYLAHKNQPIPELNTPFFPIIKKCLEKDKELRYQDYNSLRKDLENLNTKVKD